MAECVSTSSGRGRTTSEIWPGTSATRRGERGFFQPLLRSIAGGRVALQFKGKQLHAFAKNKVSKPADVLGRKANQALALAGFEGARVLVLATDADKESGSKATKVEARRQRREKLAAIEDGFAEAREVDPELIEIKTLVAIPCRMIEAWALADAEAIRQAIGAKGEPTLPPGSPEDYWGDEQKPASNYPKCALARAVGEDPPESYLADIAAHARLDVLAARCPESFAPFLEEARAMLDGCAPPEEAKAPPAKRQKRGQRG